MRESEGGGVHNLFFSADSLFPIGGYLVSLWLLLYVIEIPVFNVNSVAPDPMPYSAVSDLGPHCLPVSHYGVSHKNGLTTETGQSDKVIYYTLLYEPAHNKTYYDMCNL